MSEKVEQRGAQRTTDHTEERPASRGLVIFKAIVLILLLGATAYGMMDNGLYGIDRWFLVVAGVLGLVVTTLFARGFYEDIPDVGWVLVILMAALVAVKGASMLWTISESLTVEEILRSATYAAIFALALAALSTRRQVGPVMDVSVLMVAAVAGYGLMQKIYPLKYPVSSLDGVRMDSTLGYANTTAMVIAIGVLLALSRMTPMRNALVRGIYATLMLGFLAALFLTVSRGGIASLAIGLVCFFILTESRLQVILNSLLLAIPGGWLLWKIQSLDGLLQAGVSQQQKIEAGSQFRTDLLISLAAAFVLQAAYAFVANRYEITHRTRRLAGIFVGILAVLVLFAGAAMVVNRYGGVEKTYSALLHNPSNTQNTAARLTSLSIGLRAEYWQVAWEEWKQHPLTGSGAGTFQYVWLQNRPGYTSVKQVHNVYLEQGTETGVFAFLALGGFAVLLVAYTARGAWRATSREQRILLAGLAAALVTYLVSSAFEWHWYIPPSTMFFFILSGVAVKAAFMARQKHGEDDTPPPENQHEAVESR